ncbi:MAG: hypothetical protein NT018_00060 [Armatimonadetes bacterium]|nr:hypothetical protein [Armatimonadota bacterium]
MAMLATTARKCGHAEQKQYRDGMITTLQQQYTKLQNRLDQMYIDKLTAAFHPNIIMRSSVSGRKT